MTERVVTGPLEAGLRDAVAQLSRAASLADGASSLSEDALLRLRTDADTVHLLIGREPGEGGQLIGYAQLTRTRQPASGELMVHPAFRRRGHGRRLLARVVEVAGASEVLLWSHGDTPGAAALAGIAGWEQVRQLWRMQRPVSGLAELPVPPLPSGVRVRPFVPGQDEAAWVALNAAAFASHPEQGGWMTSDLRLRLDEPWFDASVFLLAERDGREPRLLAFCWMKPAEPDSAAELYVLGVDPSAAGRGLGRALLVRGLRAVTAPPAADGTKVVDTGMVELYVDGDNTAAIRLYRRLGFEQAAVDVQYRWRPPGLGDSATPGD